jgi:hypothetical protein
MPYPQSQGVGDVGQALDVISGGIKIAEGLFGGSSGPTHTSTTVQTPSGPLTVVLVGGDPTGGAENVFYQWAASGHLAWVQQIANTGSGPKWNNSSATQTYGASDVAFARQVVAAYGNIAPSISGSNITTTIPANPSIGIMQPVTVTLPVPTSQATPQATSDASRIAGEVTSILTYVGQGMSITNAIAYAVSRGEISQADAAAVASMAGSVASGATNVKYAAGGIATGMNLSSLVSNPYVLGAGAFALYLMFGRKRS